MSEENINFRVWCYIKIKFWRETTLDIIWTNHLANTLVGKWNLSHDLFYFKRPLLKPKKMQIKFAKV
jgi:hypothetical protein